MKFPLLPQFFAPSRTIFGYFQQYRAFFIVDICLYLCYINKAIKSGVKTAVKKVYAAVEAGDKAAANAALVEATAIIEKAASKGVYHKNNAARKVSAIAKAVNTMA